MKKVIVTLVLVLAFGSFLYYRDTLTPRPGYVVPDTAAGSETPITANPGVVYKDGLYTGAVADAFYGNLQVKAVIHGGKLTDVQFLQYPNDRETSKLINEDAMPRLKTEAIAIQSSQVDVVSGATQTSEAFRVTLASALNQAR